MALKRFFSFCSSIISEIKSEVEKQLRLQLGENIFHSKSGFL